MAAISGNKPVDVRTSQTTTAPAQAPPSAQVQPPEPQAAPAPPKDQAVHTADSLQQSAMNATTQDDKTYEGWEAASKIARGNIQECAGYLQTGQVKAVPPEQASKELMTLFNHLTSDDTIGQMPITQTGRNMQQLTQNQDDLGRQAREHVGDNGYDSAARFWASNIKDQADEKIKQGMPADRAIADTILENAQVKSSDDLTLKETCPELFMAAEKHRVSHADAKSLIDESNQLSVQAEMANPQLGTWYQASAGICKYLRNQGATQLAQGQQPQLLDPQTAKNNFETLAQYWKDDRFALFPPVSIAGQELQHGAQKGDKDAISLAYFGGWDAQQRLAMRDWNAQASAIKNDTNNPLSGLSKSAILAKCVMDAPDDGKGNHFELKMSALQYLTSMAVAAEQSKHVDPNGGGNIA